jgi:2-polyprenyl-3-methyl-5-hydroxy-6-metoxy-1,4-benzoquinol methylase
MNYTQNGVIQKIIATKLVELIPQKPCDVLSILDIGCGTGFIAQRLIERGFSSEKILQVDANPESLKVAQQFAEVRTINFNSPLKFEQKFDIITSSMSLQWAENLSKTIENIKSLLNKNGIFIASIPMEGSLAEIYDALAISPFQFPKIDDISQHLTLLQNKKFQENAFISLKNLHNCNLKLTTQSTRINHRKIASLKTKFTQWNIGFFIYTN